MIGRTLLTALTLVALSASTQAQAADKAVLMLNWYVYGEHAPFIFGKEKGFYKDEGIDLEIQEGRGSVVTVQAVAANTATFGLADVGVMIKAVAKGAPVKSVGVLLQRTPAAIIAPEGKITSPKDIAGKTIAITPGDAVLPMLPLYLKKIGVAEGSFKTVAGDAQTKLNAVVNGQADGLIGFTTEQGARLPDIISKPVIMLRFADAGINLVSLGMVASNDTIKTKADLVQRFMRATTRAVEESEKDPEGAIKSMFAAYPKVGLPEAQLRSLKYSQALYRTDEAKGRRPFRMNPSLIAETLDLLTEYGGLDAASKGKPENYYIADFVQ